MEEAVRLLENHKVDDAKGNVMELLEALTGITRTQYLVGKDSDMPAKKAEALFRAVARRAGHEPLQHILGYAYFYGRKYTVSNDVLVPRFDTECVVEYALQRMPQAAKVLDMCTGSGCIGITVALEKKGTAVTAADVSDAALKIARKNAADLQADVKFIHSDLFEKIEKDTLYDIIISNPPYIPTPVIETLSEEVRAYEPRLALDGKTDGLYFYDRIIREGRAFLKEGGRFVFEIGSDQAGRVTELLEKAGFKRVECQKDLAGLDRIVSGVR